jgi:hypothetical protein
MIDSSAGNRNPVRPIIHVIDDALGRLLYFPIGYQRGLLHSSEIGPGESAMGLNNCRAIQPRGWLLYSRLCCKTLIETNHER